MEQQELTKFSKKTISVKQATKGIETDEPLFKELLFFVDNIYLFDYDAEKIGKCSLAISGTVKTEFKKSEKKWIDKFFVCRDLQYENCPEIIEDAIDFKSLEEAIEGILAEYGHKFLARFKLIETRRYLLNLQLKRVIVNEGKIIEVD